VTMNGHMYHPTGRDSPTAPHPTHCLRYNINSLKHFVGAEE